MFPGSSDFICGKNGLNHNWPMMAPLYRIVSRGGLSLEGHTYAQGLFSISRQ